ncbi:hypothetical protein DL240_17155 [Lujinxingia litoralis]|uniref:DUF4336 domain-containing protein n=1 Tax=Lujinxingia litoralis TaxID=2211119 RepID=A0A328C5M1_9DELT|nr:DUF4336 domain-containing protein [Lujinxingia litoralis]RAL20310.1 hypothetical protein DL240_17155 [Lujinxingia litoralis]
MSRLRAFAPDIWLIDHPLKLAGVQLGTRATLVRLPSGQLTLISPVPLSDDDQAEIDALGTLSTLIAPNLFHHLFLKSAIARWPRTRVLVPPGLPEKLGEPAELTQALPLSPGGALEDTLSWQRIEGMPRLHEHVFYDPRSRTLILTDLCFHFPSHPHWWTRQFMRLNSGLGRFGPTRVLRSAIADKAAFAASLPGVLEWDFERVIMAHGEPLSEGGHARFQQAFAGELQAK